MARVSTVDPSTLPVAVIGAGPVGLAAAAHLAERGQPFVVLEAGPAAGTAIAQWGHVRLFSPWRYTTDAAARRLLVPAGWQPPDPDALPTGAELVTSYLRPLASVATLAPHIRYGARVVAVARRGIDRVRTPGRADQPFLVRLADGTELVARAVLDASGTWSTPNALGASGLAARGEAAAAGFVHRHLPDVLGADASTYAGRHTLVVGAGHSATGTVLALVALAERDPGTRVTWAVRATDPARAYGGGAADQLAARGALGSLLREHVEAGRVDLLTGFLVDALTVQDGRVTVHALAGAGPQQRITVDAVVAATGFRPDHAVTAELRLDVDPVLEATRALAPLIDPNEHSCGTVPPHGAVELAHPEPGFYTVGIKSYGRAPTFLLATGHEQVRSVVAELAGDGAAARQVQLDLPETGVCSTRPAGGAGRGLATGLVPVGATGLVPVGATELVRAAGPSGTCCS